VIVTEYRLGVQNSTWSVKVLKDDYTVSASLTVVVGIYASNKDTS
jgi:hypothetical protein